MRSNNIVECLRRKMSEHDCCLRAGLFRQNKLIAVSVVGVAMSPEGISWEMMCLTGLEIYINDLRSSFVISISVVLHFQSHTIAQ